MTRSVRSLRCWHVRRARCRREVGGNGGRERYRAWKADERAGQRAARPKPTVFEQRRGLAAYVEAKLHLTWSPRRSPAGCGSSTPTIRRCGCRRDDLSVAVRAGPGRAAQGARPVPAQRADQAPPTRPHRDHRQAPRHGDDQRTSRRSRRPRRARTLGGRPDPRQPGHLRHRHLVERTSRLVLLGGLPNGRSADPGPQAITAKITSLPERLRASLTWDQGKEMAQHARHDRHRRAGLLLRSAQPLAARHQREHQRPAPPVLPQRHRPLHGHPGRARRRRRRTQRPTSTPTRIPDTIERSTTSSSRPPLETAGSLARLRRRHGLLGPRNQRPDDLSRTQRPTWHHARPPTSRASRPVVAPAGPVVPDPRIQQDSPISRRG